MATKFAVREVLVLATEDDVPVGLIARTERVLTELSMLIAERPGLARKAWKTSEPLWEKPFQDQDLVTSLPEESLWLLMMNYRKKISKLLCLKLFYIGS